MITIYVIIQQTFPALLLWFFVTDFQSFRFPKSLVFLIVKKTETTYIYYLKFKWLVKDKSTIHKYNPQSLIFICVAKWRSNSATVTHVSEDNLAVCGREIDQSTKFLRVACVIFYWCVFTLSFSSLFSFCWIDFPLVVHSTRWDNGINWRILFSIDEPFTYPQHKHWKPPLPRQTASRKVSPLINPSFINHRTVFYCL